MLQIPTDLEGTLRQWILKHVSLEVRTLAGRFQQQIGSQAEETLFYLTGVQSTKHGQHSLQGHSGEALLVTPEVANIKPKKKIMLKKKKKRIYIN